MIRFLNGMMRGSVLLLSILLLQSCQANSGPYTWKSVQMVGGGFVDGIIFHPTAKDVRYARTDMGGAYKWDARQQRWQPILDWVPYEDFNLMGVESIALDPSDPDRVYLACGTYTLAHIPNGAILRSDDGARTFQRTDMPFKMGGNEDGRGNGERLAVDPHDGRVLYMGSRKDGLWKSTDRGVTFERVESFPDINETPAQPSQGGGRRRFQRSVSSGIIAVVYDPDSSSAVTACSTIYVAVSLMNGDNLFRSTDGGQTWQPVPGQPTQYRPNHMVMAPDGMLYLSYGTVPGPSRMTDGGVWKFNTKTGEWADITPEKPTSEKAFGYAAVSVDRSNPKMLIASTHYRSPDELYRSIDGGQTWIGLFGKGGAVFEYSKAPYAQRTSLHWLFDIEIDPKNSDHAIFTTGYGGHETFDLTNADRGQPTHWSVMSTGIEETVALELLSPPDGADLITAIGDYGGFVHWDLDKPASEGNYTDPFFGNTDGVACAWQKPEIIVRVGIGSQRDSGRNIGYSMDYGKTWQPAPIPQNSSAHGHIAVAADGTSWVWTPQRSASYVTSDRGDSWTQCQGLPDNIPVIADRVNPNMFYAMELFKGNLYVSTDGGVSFDKQELKLPGGLPPAPRGIPDERGDSRGGQDRLYSAPGTEGDLWLPAFEGLYHSTDTGKTFAKLEHVQEIHGFGFGKSAPNSTYPALYLIGVVDETRGIFRSDDTGQSWVRINDDQHQWGLVLHITGDPKKYGRVYVGTHGRGTIYGDPVQ